MSTYGKLPEDELIQLLSDFHGRNYTDAMPEEKLKFHNSYREVEDENIKSIEKYGGITNQVKVINN